jgi:hypothetical protein
MKPDPVFPIRPEANPVLTQRVFWIATRNHNPFFEGMDPGWIF